MKRKLLLSSAVISALLASGAMAQVVNFHDGANGQLSFPGVGYEELFAGQGAYSDPGNDIWNGFGGYAGYQSTYFYSGAPGNLTGPFPQQYGNPGNPYAAYNAGHGWVTSTGPNLFSFSTGSLTNAGNATSAGQWTPITLSVGGYSGDGGLGNVGAFSVPNGSPSFLLGETAIDNSTNPVEVFTLKSVPAGTYGLYLYGANYDNDRGTTFAVSSGTAHNGIASTLNSGGGFPANSFVEGQNLVIFENVTPTAGVINITATPNAQDGVGNSNLSGETDVNGFQLIFNPPPTALGMTAAQNVLAGGTASFSFTPVFAASPTFHWQSVIASVTNTLSDGSGIAGSGTTNLTISSVSGASVGLYQCVISTATATNTSPAAPLTLLTSPATGQLQWGDAITAPGNVLETSDAVSDLNNTLAEPYDAIPAPFVMGVGNVLDNDLDQYVNFGANSTVPPFSGPVSFAVTPKIGPTIVTGLRFFTSSSHPEDDPADYLLEGSSDGGTNYTTIAGGLLALPAQRNAAGGPISVANDVLQEIDFANATAYTTYQLTFTNVKNDAIASNGMQVAEVQILGTLPAAAPVVVQQPPPTVNILSGVTYIPTVVVSNAGPFTYKWTLGATVLGSTSGSLTLANVSGPDAGSYNCVITSPYGVTNAAFTLNVVTPTAYESNLITLNPLAYWPLDETSGTNAYDTVGGFNGDYFGSIVLGQPGVPFTGFGGSSLSPLFDGSSTYVDIPEGPFNFKSGFTAMAWENITSHGNFAGVFGHGDSSWRMSNNGSGQPGASDGGAGDATSSTSIIDGNWHLVAYTYTGVLQSPNNGSLYVDGELVANDTVNGPPAGNNLDVWIGGSPDYGSGRLVPGNIAHAAVFTRALTSNEIQSLYFSSEPAPLVSVPATLSVDLNGNVTIASSAKGKPPFGYQWYEVISGVTNSIMGATNGTLSLSDVQAAQGSYQYFVVVTNAFGASMSPYVALTILSGQPTIVNDLSPLLVEAPAGVPMTYFVGVNGTEPFGYQWSTSSGPIAGATDSDYSFDILAGSNTYSVAITNSDGMVTSSTAVVLGLTNPPPIITFNTDGTNWSLNEGATTLPTIADNVLTLTMNLGGEAGSGFFNTPQYIGGFIASYVYIASGNKGADGTTFCVQDDPTTTNAVGAGGGDLGFFGITNSAGFEINLYTGANGGSGIQFGTDGSTPDSGNPTPPYVKSGVVDPTTGDPIYVQLYYKPNDLKVWLVDEITGGTFVTNYTVDLPSVVGAPSAYVGFTAGDGGVASTQSVSNFLYSYTTPPILTVTHVGGNAIISWPESVSTLLKLQQSAAVNGPWTPVNVAPQIVNSQNEVTLPIGPATAFFELSLY